MDPVLRRDGRHTRARNRLAPTDFAPLLQDVLTNQRIHLVDIHTLLELKLEGLGFAGDPDDELGIEVQHASPLLGDHLDALVGNAADVLL